MRGSIYRTHLYPNSVSLKSWPYNRGGLIWLERPHLEGELYMFNAGLTIRINSNR